MLRQRLISALIMVPLVVLAVLKLDGSWFALLVAAAMLLAAWEWGPLVPLRGSVTRIAYLVFVLALIGLSWRSARAEIFVDTVLWLALAWWLFVLFWITRPALGSGETGAHALAKALLGCGLMVSTWLSLVVLHSLPEHGPYWVLYLLVLVWVADSGAF
ncbi:MAG: phosphatidate cytidylyltransferase, partial [Thiogranum sp.]